MNNLIESSYGVEYSAGRCWIYYRTMQGGYGCEGKKVDRSKYGTRILLTRQNFKKKFRRVKKQKHPQITQIHDLGFSIWDTKQNQNFIIIGGKSVFVMQRSSCANTSLCCCSDDK